MKRNSKILAVLLTLALVMSLAAVSAFAESQTTTSFDKYLIVDSSAQIPNLGFDFSIAPGTAIAGTSTTLSIKAGIGTPTIYNTANASAETDAVFTSGMATTAGTPTDSTDTTKKYATSNVTIDFSSVNFTEPGIYRYEITETQGSAPGVTYDGTTRYLDVFVEKNGDACEITGYAMRTTEDTFDITGDPMVGYSDQEDPDVKESSFTNSLETVDLTFSKTIEGNQADMTKRFEFTLNLSNVNPGTYELAFSGDDDAIVGENNPNVDANNGVYTITVGSDGTYEGTFYLTNNDSVTVKDLNKGFGYEVQEDPEDYTETNDGDTTGTNIQTDATEAFTNTHNGIIPTGVIITVAPFMIGLLLFGAVMMFMISRRRRAAY